MSLRAQFVDRKFFVVLKKNPLIPVFCSQIEMGRCDFVVWLLLACLVGDSLSQYREKNISEWRDLFFKAEHHCDCRKSKSFLRILFRTNLQFS